MGGHHERLAGLAPGGDGVERVSLEAADDLRDQRITALLHDSDGVLWAGSFADGLKRRDPVSRHFYTYRHNSQDRHGVGDNQISALYQDRTGTLWVGNWYTGLDWVDLTSGGFERYTEYPGVMPSISNNKVRVITGAGPNKYWLGTGNGLTLLDSVTGATEVWRHNERDPSSLPGDQIQALQTDKRGRLWVGSSTGLGWRDAAGGPYTRFVLDAAPAAATIQRILVDRAGAIWVASRAGLHRIGSAKPARSAPGAMTRPTPTAWTAASIR